MQEDLIAASRRALFLAAALAALPASAVVLGELEVRSALGEALDARIPLGNSDGEMVDATCFSLAREGEAVIPLIGEGILTVERSGGAPVLRVRSLARIYEPAVMLRVRAACPGQSGYVLRQYSVLLDPRPGREIAIAPPLAEARGRAESASAPQDRAAGAPAPSRVPAVSAILSARSGDSLRSIASKVFPRNREARGQYLAALREANPAFAGETDSQLLPEGAPIALPDLRTFAGIETPVARRPRERIEPVARAEPAAAPQRRVRARSAAAEAPAAVPPQRTAAAPRPAGDGFVLKLSSGEVDLARSRAIDDRLRAQLRERLLVLDADDQVSALLAMRDSLRKLETRVAELQLKLSAMPPSLTANAPAARETTASAQPPALTRPPASPDPATVASPARPKAAEPPAESATSAASATPQPGSIEPAPIPPPTKAEPPVQPPPAQATGGTKPKAAPGTDSWRVGLDRYLWGVVALLVALALLLAWRLRRRHQQEHEYEAIEPQFGAEEAITEQIEIAPEPQRAVAGSDAALPTRLQDDSAQLRRRYIEERFPEVVNRTIVLDDPNSVVKGARLFYEDGALLRAVELLQFAIDENPGEVRPWLALFEIFRLERLTAEFGELARRFHERHGKSEYWPKVQFIGREIDPGNHLYKDENLNKLETIGPAAARRIAAATFDPIAENWLNAPMDFQNQVLANELRRALMTEAAITEQDLVPNPMPALRNTEMYQLA